MTAMTEVTPRTVEVLVAGEVLYKGALAWQRERASLVRAGGPEALALVEHTPVYTMGRRGGRASVLRPPEAMPALVVDVERGGDVTWHGPGQLVGYPILDLRSRRLRAADYVRMLEQLVIEVLGQHDLIASVVPGRPGVWVGEAKVAAIGVAIRGGVSFHGFALNVAPDLRWYDAIVPCGLADASVTSMAALLGEAPPLGAVVEGMRAAFERRFASRLVEVDAAPLRGMVTA